MNVVECAKYYGLEAYVSSLNFDKLQKLVNTGVPIIANILKFADGDLNDWPAYDTEKRSTQIFDRGVSSVSDPGATTRNAWGDAPISFR